jgi:hypothetical protein
MHPDEPARVLAVAAGLGAKAGRIGRVADGQAARLQDLLAVQVDQRHLCRRREEVLALACRLEGVALELGQLAGALERVAAQQRRRPHLAVAALDVAVDHEADQRARQPRPGAAQHAEARTRDLGRAREVEDAERLAHLPVRPRRERHGRLVAPHRHHRVVGLAMSVGHRGVRRVGDDHEQLRGVRLDLAELPLACLDALGQLAQLVARRGELGRLLVESGHALVGGVALGPQLVEILLQRAAPAVQIAHPVDQRGNLAAASPQHLIEARNVQHFDNLSN